MSHEIESRDRSQTIVAFLKGEMTDEERTGFEMRIAEDESLQEAVEQAKEVFEALSAASELPIIEQVKSQLTDAISRGASDIHIIPDGKSVQILYRIDGALINISTISSSLLQPVVDRWKVMSDMHLGERRLPQDGRFPVHYQGKEFTIRVSIVPSLYGERVTARILSQTGTLIGLDNLGYTGEQIAALRRLCRLRSGMLLVGGGSGVGRSTVMYSLLREMQQPGYPLRNLLTLEDPVEMSISTTTFPVTQTAINPSIGTNFANMLKCLLRSDPDVIYCSEIRDKETTETAMEVASRGVLLLGSVPVTGALSIIERIHNMGIKRHLIADSVAGLIGLSLVRQIDRRQVEEYTPEASELARAGLTAADGPFVRGVPTVENGNTGFAGRVPLIEIVEFTPLLRRRFAQGANIETLTQVAFPNGGTLRDVARARVKAGLTTVEEINWALFDYPAN